MGVVFCLALFSKVEAYVNIIVIHMAIIQYSLALHMSYILT